MANTPLILAVCYGITTWLCLQEYLKQLNKIRLLKTATATTVVLSLVMVPVLAVSGFFQLLLSALIISNACALKYPKFMAQPTVTMVHAVLSIVTYITLFAMGLLLILK